MYLQIINVPQYKNIGVFTVVEKFNIFQFNIVGVWFRRINPFYNSVTSYFKSLRSVSIAYDIKYITTMKHTTYRVSYNTHKQLDGFFML